jgi:hypothetical protein
LSGLDGGRLLTRWSYDEPKSDQEEHRTDKAQTDPSFSTELPDFGSRPQFHLAARHRSNHGKRPDDE